MESFLQVLEEDGAWRRITDDGAALCGANSRVHAKIDGRFVSVLRGLDGRALYCIDAVCYHMGGPLTVGDIEEVNGHECVVCPWHHYSVTLKTGAKLYQAMEFDAQTRKLVPAGWKASEKRQRVHDVEQRGHAGAVWVRLTSNDRSAKRHDEQDSLPCGSDKWAYKASAAHNVCRKGMSKGGDGKSVRKIRSGDGKYPGARSLSRSRGGANTKVFGEGSSRGSFRRSGDVLRQARDNAARMLHRGAAGVGAAGGTKNVNGAAGSSSLFSPAGGKQKSTSAAVPLQTMAPTHWSTFLLQSRKQITESMWVFRFSLPSAESRLGWNHVERHLKVRAVVRGQEVVREYTPVSPLDQCGSFDLAVKVYPHGLMSRHIADLREGSPLEMCGPFGDVTIGTASPSTSRSPELTISLRGGIHARVAVRVTMIAAGSGITPMLQILRHASSHYDAGLPDVDLIYANKTSRDIAFRPQIEGISRIWGGNDKRFEIFHALSQETKGGGRIGFRLLEQVFREGGRGSMKSGLGTESEAVDHQGAAVGETATAGKGRWAGVGHFALVCGSSEFENSMRTLLVEGFGFQEDHVCTF
eukprot:g2211.t1